MTKEDEKYKEPIGFLTFKHKDSIGRIIFKWLAYSLVAWTIFAILVAFSF